MKNEDDFETWNVQGIRTKFRKVLEEVEKT